MDTLLNNPQPEVLDVDRFQTDLLAQCGSFEIAPSNSSDLVGHLSNHRSGGLDISWVCQNTERIYRNQANIRKDPADDYFMVLQYSGEIALSQANTNTHIKSGDIFLVDSTKPVQLNYSGGYSEQISIQLARDEMTHRFGALLKGGLTISNTDPLGQAMRTILLKILASDNKPQHHAAEAFYSVFGALIFISSRIDSL